LCVGVRTGALDTTQRAGADFPSGGNRSAGQRTFDLEAADDAWTLVRIDEDFSQRSSSRFEGNDRVETVGERSYDGGATWEPDYTLTLRRVVARSEG